MYKFLSAEKAQALFDREWQAIDSEAKQANRRVNKANKEIENIRNLGNAELLKHIFN